MNDAEAGPALGPGPSRVAFFQVVLTDSVPGKLLPVQPFLVCAGEAVARLGTLRLGAVQLLLPERDDPETGRGEVVAIPLQEALHWFAGRDPRTRAPVRVTLDGSPDPSVRAAAPAIAQHTEAIRQDVFVCESLSLSDDDHLILRPIPFEDERASTPHHRVTFRGSLVEWSLDVLGWLAAFLADGSSRQGISTPLLLTAERLGPLGSPAS